MGPTGILHLADQALPFPCLVVPLDEPARQLLGATERWPRGVRIEEAGSHLVLPRTGDVVVLVLIAWLLVSFFRKHR